MKNLLSIVLAFFVFSYSQVVWSQTPSPGAGWVPGIVQGNTVWFGPANATKGSATMGQAIWSSAVKGGATVATTAKIATATGEAALVVKGVATGASIFGAVKLLAMGSTGVIGIGLTALTMVPMAIDYFSTENTRLGPLSTRETDKPFEMTSAVSQTMYRCSYAGKTAEGSSVLACASAAAKLSNGFAKCDITESSRECYFKWSLGSSSSAGMIGVDEFVGSGLKWVPASMDDIARYMDTPEKVTTPQQIQEFLDKGASIPISYAPTDMRDYFPADSAPAPVKGPASVPGVPTVKTTDDGTNTTTTTTTPKTDLSYSTGKDADGKLVPKVTGTSGSTTVTTVTNNETGETKTTGTTTETKPSESIEEKPDYSFSDSSFPEIPKLYERVYPDGITGVWNEKMGAIKSTPLFMLGRDIMPALAATGSCPVFTVPLDLVGWASYGAADVSPPCWVWDFGKVVIVCSSLLLARRLIFGG